MFRRGQRVQYKDVRQSQEIGKKDAARKLAGCVGTVVNPDFHYPDSEIVCTLHGRACDYVQVRFSRPLLLVNCHAEHLIPLDADEERSK